MILALAVVSGAAISGQDRYTVKLPNGLSFSEWKGYGDWQLISSAETDDRMKVILGNPTISRLLSLVHHASADDPQYEIKSDKTDHIAMHKGTALRKFV